MGESYDRDVMMKHRENEGSSICSCCLDVQSYSHSLIQKFLIEKFKARWQDGRIGCCWWSCTGKRQQIYCWRLRETANSSSVVPYQFIVFN
ncbi:uncharacterized protein PHALS_15231 [Plasmopara halstedii]|uniref:Uncharacterized protein n=1 Tax=Plasmopara halstedii TaxID=4781 RepID=A0A0N7L8F6_PLAHL|nr:uncharacterized protein PHALS_15231 [Plasmopara halstedii]CEG49739.1 hypothetical protein PHALS_15231 [Plasmopara halstedii]|eukprot:XP_024586108.1 hypothetical protein PHALS_15231 [Plasmopara halstedii]